MPKLSTRYIVTGNQINFEINVNIQMLNEHKYPVIKEDVSAIIPVKGKWDVRFALNDLFTRVKEVVEDMRKSV